MTTLLRNELAARFQKNFILSGKAIFTVVSEDSGKSYTYKVKAKMDANDKVSIYFVSLLTGSDNENSYTYLGFIRPNTEVYVHGVKSPISDNATSVKAFVWFWNRIRNAQNVSKVRVIHSGRCARCQRVLTTENSVILGIGPECSKILGL